MLWWHPVQTCSFQKRNKGEEGGELKPGYTNKLINLINKKTHKLDSKSDNYRQHFSNTVGNIVKIWLFLETLRYVYF